MRPLVTLIVGTVGLTSTACGSPSQPSGPPPTVTGVIVTGPSRVALGQTASYTATAYYSDASSKDVTTLASWRPTSDATWLPIYFTSAGVALGASRGEFYLGAIFGGEYGMLRVLALESGTFKLTGAVSETSGRPLPAVAIDILSGTGSGLHATTDSQGQYTLYGVAGTVQLRASANGFTPQIRDVAVAADGPTDPLVLVPIDTPVDISGSWTMTLSPSAGCRAGLPAIARSRVYQVHFMQQGTGLKVTIESPTLWVYDAGDYGTILGSHVQFVFIGDADFGDWSGANLIDQLSPTETLQFDGTVQGTVAGSELRATMNGDLMYWVTPTQSIPNWYCRATDHVVVLRR